MWDGADDGGLAVRLWDCSLSGSEIDDAKMEEVQAALKYKPDSGGAQAPVKSPPRETKKKKPEAVCDWSCEDVLAWSLEKKLKLEADVIQEADLNGELLLQVEDTDLQEAFGVKLGIHRKKILLEISKLKQALTSPPTLPPLSADVSDTCKTCIFQ